MPKKKHPAGVSIDLDQPPPFLSEGNYDDVAEDGPDTILAKANARAASLKQQQLAYKSKMAALRMEEEKAASSSK